MDSFFKRYSFWTLLYIFSFLIFFTAQAEDYTSPSFILRDPVITIEGGLSTSNLFQLFMSIGETIIGESTSTAFVQRAGFQYYPEATSPVVVATAGNGQVSLSWTTAVGSLANITNYELGTAAVSGGPHTFESVGNVTSFPKTGLTNGTTYYFRVKAFAGTLLLAQSAEVSSTPIAPTPTPAPAGGGGGGAVAPPTVTKVIIQGKAYPLSSVNVLKDGQAAVTTIADSQANFKVELTTLTAGTYTFGVWAEDKEGRKSIVFNFTTSVTAGAITTISGIFLPPTIELEKTALQIGETLNILGQTAPESEISVFVNSPDEIVKKTKAEKDGTWFYGFDTTPLEEGSHTTRSKAASIEGLLSTFSQTLGFAIGKEAAGICQGKADINNDKKVNLVDFSILLYNWGIPKNSKTDLNCDGKVNLTDFSIMMYWWTG